MNKFIVMCACFQVAQIKCILSYYQDTSLSGPDVAETERTTLLFQTQPQTYSKLLSN